MTDAQAIRELVARGFPEDVAARAVGMTASPIMAVSRSETRLEPVNNAAKSASPSWTIRIPGWHPPSDNAIVGEHWGAKVRVKKAAAEMVGIYVVGIPPAAGKRRVWTHLVMAPKQRCPDPTNLFKVLLDSLKKHGLLRDDSDKWCAAERPTFSRGAERITFITLEEMG